MKINKESFEWIDLKEPPKDRLLKVVAKTTKTTIHPDDPEYPIRLFAEADLIRNANMVGRPVGLNHSKLPIYGSYVVDSEYNEEEKQLEALLFVPVEYVKKVAEGLIDHVSVEYTWRSDKKTPKGTEFTGLNITRVDLIEGLEPGDSNAQVVLFEAKSKRGKIIMEVKKEKFVTAVTKDERESESKGKEQEEPIPTTQEECEKKSWYWYEDACHKEPKAEEFKEEQAEPEKDEHGCIKDKEVWDEEQKKCVLKSKEPTAEELKEAFKRVVKENAKLKADLDKKLKEAVAEAKEDVLKAIEGKIPNNMITGRFNMGAQRLVCELKKTIRKTREE